jgi:cysteine desulfurase / selenocysteine lyase
MTPTTKQGLDLVTLRAQFPVLSRTVHGKPLASLDNAATKHKPQAVIDAELDFYSRYNANVHRGMHELSREATEAYESARVLSQRFLNASDQREIVFTSGVTDALNLVAYSFARHTLKPGDRILLTQMEHHSNIVPWQLIAEEKCAQVIAAPVTDSGEIDLEAFEQLLDERVKIVSMVAASNALGTVNPIARMIEMAKAVGATTVVDAAQAAAAFPIDVRALGCDFLGFTGHKLYGPTGIGVLFGRFDLLQSMPPFKGGGEMIRSVSFERTTYADAPTRFEAGTPNIAGAIGLAAAIEWFTNLDRHAVMAHEQDLAQYGQQRLAEIPGIRLIGTAPAKLPIFSFVVDWAHAYDIGPILDRQGVAVRTGHHCTEPLMARFGVPATVRASCAAYTTREEIDQLVAALHKARSMLA